MTYDQIINWQYANGVEDEWFVAVGGNSSPFTKALLEIKAIKDNGPQLMVHILHVSSKDDQNAEWVLFESHEEIVAQLTPKRALYNKENKKFNATMEQMMSLAQKAIRRDGHTVTKVSQGFVAFETGMTWGSWSGASCSISIEENEPFWFTVRGGGKQNLRGGQLIALDFGEAAGKAKKVISTMKAMATAQGGEGSRGGGKSPLMHGFPTHVPGQYRPVGSASPKTCWQEIGGVYLNYWRWAGR